MCYVERPCPICSSNSIGTAFENRMPAVAGFDMSYTVGRCNSCGFHFAHQLADAITFEQYYKHASKYDVATQVSPIDEERIQSAIEFCASTIESNALIVDLGCGFGAMLAALNNAGWSNTYGVDPAPNSASRAKLLFGVERIYCATLHQAHTVAPLSQADVVCFMAVLEHLPNLRSDILLVLSQLKPGCRVLVEVPAVECFSGKLGEPFGEFSLEHIQFFTENSLINFFTSLGWQAEKIDVTALSTVASGCIFGLFSKSTPQALECDFHPESAATLQRYIDDSFDSLQRSLERIPDGPLIVYGAGSHSARLVPHLQKRNNIDIVAIVDSNANLQGKNIGTWVVQPPSLISDLPSVPILVSSFRSQREITKSLRSHYSNPLILMYDESDH